MGATTTSRARHGGIGGLGGSSSPYCHIAQKTAVSFGRELGNGVCPTVSTITASGFCYSASAAFSPATISVPPPPRRP